MFYLHLTSSRQSLFVTRALLSHARNLSGRGRLTPVFTLVRPLRSNPLRLATFRGRQRPTRQYEERKRLVNERLLRLRVWTETHECRANRRVRSMREAA